MHCPMHILDKVPETTKDKLMRNPANDIPVAAGGEDAHLYLLPEVKDLDRGLWTSTVSPCMPRTVQLNNHLNMD